MKAHKYWSLGALAAMIGTFYTEYSCAVGSSAIIRFGSFSMIRYIV